MLIDYGCIVLLKRAPWIDLIAKGKIGQPVGFTADLLQPLNQVDIIRTAGIRIMKCAIGLHQAEYIHLSNSFGDMLVGREHLFKQPRRSLAYRQGCHPKFEDIEGGKGRTGILKGQWSNDEPFARLRLQQ